MGRGGGGEVRLLMLRAMGEKDVRRVVGIMSGTSVDGIDAAVVEIAGRSGSIRVKQLAFLNRPYPPAVRRQIFALFQPEEATVDKVGYMNFLLGELYAEAAQAVVQEAGLRPEEVDLIGSHGQTIWHAPVPQDRDGYPIRYTVQIGEGAVIAARTGIPTVSDFRVADMAWGGQGAPLVPFTEYLLYRREKETVLLQNIGGIGNLTVIPASAGAEEVYAFDTGPGNMIIDAAVSALTAGRQTYDEGGRLAERGTVDRRLLALLQEDGYYRRPLPKTTGREAFGEQYTARILRWGRSHGVSAEDLIATVTDLTAWSIADAYERYVMAAHPTGEIVIGGGGSYNRTLLRFLSERFRPHRVSVKTQEELGWSSDAKEAVAFAILADCCVRETANTLPRVTGAREPAVMGKISLPGGYASSPHRFS